MMSNKAPSEMRNYGIDLLRIVSMLYIVILHAIGKGGFIETVEKGSAQYMVGWFLEMWVYCAVDIFALISGYVGYSDQKKKYNYANYFVLWLQVVVWSTVVTAVFYLINPEIVGAADFVRMLLPITSNTYWYFTAYTGLFFIIPLLNTAVRNSSEAYLRRLFVVLVVIFSVYSTLGDRWKLEDGYSFLWLTILYLLGAIIKKYGLGEKLSQGKAFAGIVLCCVLSWLWKLFENECGFLLNKSLVETYLTPTHLCSAALHVIMFSKLDFRAWQKKWIAFAAPGAFAVYLLNCHKFIWAYFVENRTAHLADQPLHAVIFSVLGFAMVFVLVSVAADHVRQKVFQRLHIRKLAQRLTDAVLKVLDFGTKTQVNIN